MRRLFKDIAIDLARADERVVMLFGDISVFLFRHFQENFPDRFYNLGICENTIISAAAGLNMQGFVPFVHTITPFITERCLEQIKLDLCYNRFSANIVTCGASFDYAWDGATHHCYTDLSILRLLPGMEVMQPGSIKEMDVLMRSQYKSSGPSYFRLSDHPHDYELDDIEFGKAAVLKDTGSDVTIMTAGPILKEVMGACEGLDVNIVYFHTIKPIDIECISRYKNTKIIVVHDAFGLHEAVSSHVPVQYCIGLPDEFFCHYGTVEDIRKTIGLDAESIRKKLKNSLNIFDAERSEDVRVLS
jgi:transketolase